MLGEDYAKYISLLANKAKSLVRDLDPINDLSFLRIKTRNEEIMVTPDKDFMLIAIQQPKATRDRKDDENWSKTSFTFVYLNGSFSLDNNFKSGSKLSNFY